MSERARPRSGRFLEACARRGIMLATAESCTGGMIIAALTDIAGSSSVVDRGFVTYSNDAKMDMLGVSAATLDAFGAVSARDGRRDGGGRAGPFAGRHRGRGDRHCRPGRRIGGQAGRAGLVRPGGRGARRCWRRASVFEDRGRAFIRRETVVHALRMVLEALE